MPHDKPAATGANNLVEEVSQHGSQPQLVTSGDIWSPFGYYQQSSQICNIFIYNVYSKMVAISGKDWVGAFNGETLVGAKQWDTSQCGGGICDIQIMGKDGSDLTQLYADIGDIITFKIFIESDNIYYPDQTVIFQPLGLITMEQLGQGRKHIKRVL